MNGASREVFSCFLDFRNSTHLIHAQSPKKNPMIHFIFDWCQMISKNKNCIVYYSHGASASSRIFQFIRRRRILFRLLPPWHYIITHLMFLSHHRTSLLLQIQHTNAQNIQNNHPANNNNKKSINKIGKGRPENERETDQTETNRTDLSVSSSVKLM